MTIIHKFSVLTELIASALVPSFLAEHVFANKDRIAEALQKDKTYSFRSPTGETIQIDWDGDA